jgi:rhodanese-related sulfurtransferase
VIDVRNAPEVAAEGRIEGSVNIPMNELPARLAEVPEGAEVVAVCKKGMRSFNAAGWLRQMGRRAVSLQGGIDQWKALGLPVAR